MNDETKKRNQEISAKIKGKLAERKVRQNVLSKQLGIADITASQKLNGLTGFTVGEFAIIATLYDFSPAEVLEIVAPKIFSGEM